MTVTIEPLFRLAPTVVSQPFVGRRVEFIPMYQPDPDRLRWTIGVIDGVLADGRFVIKDAENGTIHHVPHTRIYKWLPPVKVTKKRKRKKKGPIHA